MSGRVRLRYPGQCVLSRMMWSEEHERRAAEMRQRNERERLASRLGTGFIQAAVQSTGAAALGHDPRYISSADQSIPRRIGHAFLYSLFTYNNEGKRRPALANLSSYYASSMLATCWYPARYTALGDGVRDGNRQVIMAGLINQIQEFWPEIKKYVFRRR